MQDLQWKCAEFEKLSSTELYGILQLRSEVFVVEQDCVYQDIDGYDQPALHVSGTIDGNLVCYARVLPPGLKYEGASIGRVIVRKASRGTGCGEILMHQAIAYSRLRWPNTRIVLSAQQHLEKFYTALGFESVSEPYMEDGIPHVEMVMP